MIPNDNTPIKTITIMYIYPVYNSVSMMSVTIKLMILLSVALFVYF